MQETDDEVNILALRNAAWSGKDIELLEEVSRQLEIVATKGMMGMCIGEYQLVPSSLIYNQYCQNPLT
jgi:hypothetical protein